MVDVDRRSHRYGPRQSLGSLLGRWVRGRVLRHGRVRVRGFDSLDDEGVGLRGRCGMLHRGAGTGCSSRQRDTREKRVHATDKGWRRARVQPELRVVGLRDARQFRRAVRVGRLEAVLRSSLAGSEKGGSTSLQLLSLAMQYVTEWAHSSRTHER